MSYSRFQSRAFSLIEVLIAVVVLSIGLLGLGMVFPVVVRQQRIAQDQVRGLSSERSFEASLLTRSDINKVLHDPNPVHNDYGSKLFLIARSLRESNQEQQAYRWFVPAVGTTASSANPFVIDSLPGPTFGRLMLFFNDNDTATQDLSSLSVGQRLYPAPFTSMGDPQFINDIAIRQVDADHYELAIFTRRVDAGIRIPPPIQGRQFTLSNILTATPTTAAGFQRAPVAVDARGRPTLTGDDGQGRPKYSSLRIMKFSPRALVGGDQAGNTTRPPGARYEINPYLTGDSQFRTELYAVAGQPGQKFVDNLGTIHTVVRSERSVVSAAALIVYLDRPLSDEAELLRQNNRLIFVFAPQVPSSVSVMRFDRGALEDNDG